MGPSIRRRIGRPTAAVHGGFPPRPGRFASTKGRSSAGEGPAGRALPLIRSAREPQPKGGPSRERTAGPQTGTGVVSSANPTVDDVSSQQRADTRTPPRGDRTAASCSWRWGDSNPRPRATDQGFSGRSRRKISSRDSRRRRTSRPARVRFPAAAPGRNRCGEPAHDARPRVAGEPGRTAT